MVDSGTAEILLPDTVLGTASAGGSGGSGGSGGGGGRGNAALYAWPEGSILEALRQQYVGALRPAELRSFLAHEFCFPAGALAGLPSVTIEFDGEVVGCEGRGVRGEGQGEGRGSRGEVVLE